jgi:hypothetical protein
MNLIRRGLDVTTATQFPPLLLQKLNGNERKLAIEYLVKQAKKGDMVFSSHRLNAMSAAIRKFDGSQFSHVAIYLGDGEVGDVGHGGAKVIVILLFYWSFYWTFNFHRAIQSSRGSGRWLRRDGKTSPAGNGPANLVQGGF